MKNEAFNQQDRTLRRYLHTELLIIDDFGLKQLPKNSGEHLFEMIMRRFLHHAQTIAITGRSYRLKNRAAVAGKEDKNKKGKSKSNEPLAAEPAS